MSDPRMYFVNAAEADDWLDFEADGDTVESAFYAENDRYVEWQRWRAVWALNTDVDPMTITSCKVAAS